MKRLSTFPIKENPFQMANLIRLVLLMTLIVPFFWLGACEEQNKLTPDDKDSTKTDPCKTNHTGGICLKNSMSGTVTVYIDGGGLGGSQSKIAANSTGCLILKEGKHSWESRVGIDVTTERGPFDFYVLECVNDSVEIK